MFLEGAPLLVLPTAPTASIGAENFLRGLLPCLAYYHTMRHYAATIIPTLITISFAVLLFGRMAHVSV